MNCGYHAYQFVTVANGAKRFALPAPPAKPSDAAKKQHHEQTMAARKTIKKSSTAAVPADVLEAVKARKLQSKSPQGTIVSAQLYKEAQSATHSLRISATYPVGQLGVPNDVMLQTLVTDISESNEIHTAFDSVSRTFYVVADNYPRANVMTAWVPLIVLAVRLDKLKNYHSRCIIVFPRRQQEGKHIKTPNCRLPTIFCELQHVFGIFSGLLVDTLPTRVVSVYKPIE